MTKFRLLHAGALGALALALGLSALPAQAQVEDYAVQRNEAGAVPRERPAISARQAPEAQPQARAWSGGGRDRSESPAARSERREARSEAPRAAVAPTRNAGYGADRNATYTAPRDRSYGGDRRARDWSAQRQARDAAAQQQPQPQRPVTGWSRPGDRRDDARRADWQRDRSDDARRADWQRDRRDDARRDDARRTDWHRDRRDGNRNYTTGYDNRRRDGNRYGQNHRRWDNRGWRSDNRYNWYRHRAANRSLFSLGRYYAPYRGYSYSRINIGFRLGSPFYSNRYWINDPWRYRLPDVYGPYRWVRYYDDALLVDIYSGEVVDVIHNFFW